jgi:hypothetical protein
MPAEDEYVKGMQQTQFYQGQGMQAQPQATAEPQPMAQQAQPANAEQGASRYNLMQMLEQQPTRDTQGEDVIRKRAKMNAIGRGLSSLAGLGGMAMGGDAPAIQDGQTPWNMNQLATMDLDYRNKLQDWTNRSFQVDQTNNQTLNREIDQNIDAENRMDQIGLQGQNQKLLAEQRAQYALQQLKAKSEAEQIKEMRSLGIDPYAEDADEQFLKLNGKITKSALNYEGSKTSRNYQYGTGIKNPKEVKEYDLYTLRAGRDAKINELQAEMDEKIQATQSPAEQNAIRARYNDLIDDEANYEPGKNPLKDAEQMERGIKAEEGELEGPSKTEKPAGGSMKFDLKNGFANIEADQDPVVKKRLSQGFQKAFEGSLSDTDLDQMIEDLIASGEAGDEEEAYFYIERYIEETKNNK